MHLGRTLYAVESKCARPASLQAIKASGEINAPALVGFTYSVTVPSFISSVLLYPYSYVDHSNC